jgi:hypothetical protein
VRGVHQDDVPEERALRYFARVRREAVAPKLHRRPGTRRVRLLPRADKRGRGEPVRWGHRVGDDGRVGHRVTPGFELWRSR